MNVIMVLTLCLLFCSSCSSTTAVKSIPRLLLSTLLNIFANIFMTMSWLRLQKIDEKEVPSDVLIMNAGTCSFMNIQG